MLFGRWHALEHDHGLNPWEKNAMRLGTLARWVGRLLSRWGDDGDRCIFGFWDGTRWRRVDPLPVFRAIESDPEFNVSRDPGLYDRGDPDATARAVAAVKRAFGVETFDGERGLTETECLLLLNEFWAYCGDVKKKASQQPTLPPPTAPEPSDVSITNSDSDCGCASTENRTVTASP